MYGHALTSRGHRADRQLRWGIEQRLAFIESRLFWDGSVNRADLMGAFDISVPQASKDLSLYQARAPGNVRYDSARKCYVPTDDFVARFARLDPDAYLRGLADSKDEGAAEAPPVAAERLPIPHRRIDPGVLRSLVAAVRQGLSLEVLYRSTDPAPPGQLRRRLSPHAFAHDGTRWHARAYCHREERFLDFIVSRCLEAGALAAPGKSAAQDQMWHERFAVVLCPNPRMTAAQQQVASEEYEMIDGELVIEVRYAMLFHFNKRLRLDLVDQVANPSQAPVIVKNRTAYEEALAAAYSRPQ
jgi:hypothetical protein